MISEDPSYLCKKKFDPGRTRTCNPLIRSQMPCPLGHRTSYTVFGARENPSLTTLQPKLKQQVLNLQLGTKMHQFGIRGRDGCIQKWKFWIGRKIMSDYQDRLLWMGTQTAARGVLAMYLQKSVILAATLCLLPRGFQSTNNAFWKSMIFQPFRLLMHIHIFRIFTIYAKPIQLIAIEVYLARLL